MAQRAFPTIWRVDDARWAELRPLLHSAKVRKQPGRPRLDDRAIFDGLLGLARTGSPWAALPRAFGAKSTVPARCQAWVEHGCLARAWARLLAVCDAVVGRDWQWQSADGCLVKAPRGNTGGPARRQRPDATRLTAGNVGRHATC